MQLAHGASALAPVRGGDLATNAILVLGSPRSGTTWLAKILDSHPDVLYRHEPDEVVPIDSGADPRRQLRTWIDVNALSTAAKRPFFRKSWLPAPLDLLRTALAHSLNGAASLLGGAPLRFRMKLPDFVAIDRRPGLRAVIKVVAWDASMMARMLPDSRVLFILRHPCGQVSSTMRGAEQRHFGSSADGSGMPLDEPLATAYAAAHGVDRGAFQALPLAAKCAWGWVAFNQTALDGLEGLENARLVRYEDLCARPEVVARDLFEFAGLTWSPQTAAFITRSTRHNGDDGYFGVFRSSTAAAERWRGIMDPADQEAVRAVVRRSRLAHFWPDLAAAG